MALDALRHIFLSLLILLFLQSKVVIYCLIYRVYKKKVDNFETALNLAKRLEV